MHVCERVLTFDVEVRPLSIILSMEASLSRRISCYLIAMWNLDEHIYGRILAYIAIMAIEGMVKTRHISYVVMCTIFIGLESRCLGYQLSGCLN